MCVIISVVCQSSRLAGGRAVSTFPTWLRFKEQMDRGRRNRKSETTTLATASLRDADENLFAAKMPKLCKDAKPVTLLSMITFRTGSGNYSFSSRTNVPLSQEQNVLSSKSDNRTSQCCTPHDRVCPLHPYPGSVGVSPHPHPPSKPPASALYRNETSLRYLSMF